MVKKLIVTLPVLLVILVLIVIYSEDHQVAGDHLMGDDNNTGSTAMFWDAKLVRLMDNNKYMKLEASKVRYNSVEGDVWLEDTYLELIDNLSVFEANADFGHYVIDKSMTATGNIHGRKDDMTYIVHSPTGVLYYDLISENGTIEDNVTFYDQEMTINSKKVWFSSSSEILFSGDVVLIIDDSPSR